jgi:hypothetical protein
VRKRQKTWFRTLNPRFFASSYANSTEGIYQGNRKVGAKYDDFPSFTINNLSSENDINDFYQF